MGQLSSGWWRLPASPAVMLVVVWLTAATTARRLEPALRCLAALALGLCTATRALEPFPARCTLPPAEGVKQWIEAVVEEPPTVRPGRIRARVAARPRDDPESPPLCGSVLLTILGSSDLDVGDRLRLHASLRRPRNFANPRAYDHVAALARQGVWITGQTTSETIEHLGRDVAGWNVAIARERSRIGRLIDSALPLAEASLLRSLVVGDQASVPPELWDEITRAGLAHLLSVSGLHIAIVWGLAFAVLRWCLSRSERLLLRTHVRALAAVAALPGALFYALLAGLSIPAARSMAMTGLAVASLTAGREAQPLRILCLAAAAIAALRPGSPLDVSFQLSFAAVFSLIAVGQSWTKRRSRETSPARDAGWRDRIALALLVPAAALIGTAPLVALHFNRFTPIGVLTNPVLVPLAGTPATVLGLAGAAVSFASETVACRVFALAYWPLALLRV
ncbi:MAG: ComEC/Rec2 family competence protein, partial [Candidatus Binatia bacterium]